MDSIVQFLQLIGRNKASIFPAKAAKSESAIRMGLLGASKIAPIAVINAALSHPDITITTVAARNKTTAETYARKHGIPHVHNTYDDLLADPSLDAVYIPLPNGLHYEWTQKALKAGKDVLLEKPSASNTAEAEALFAPYFGPESANQPILLEAVHSLFHPAFKKFISLIDAENVETAFASMLLPAGIIPDNDIRFTYSLGGGSLMDCGTYPTWALRKIFGAEPVQCVEAVTKVQDAKGGDKVDHSMEAKLKFPNGGVGTMASCLQARGGYWVGWLTNSLPKWQSPLAIATEREKVVERASKDGLEEAVLKEVTMWNFVVPNLWHRIDVAYRHVLREKATAKVVKRWEVKESFKDYGPQGREWWTTYRWQLEAFVDRIRGRNGPWVEPGDSVGQTKALDMIYEKSGLGRRPVGEYFKAG